MVVPLEAIQYNPSLAQQQPGDSLSSGAGAGYTLPGAPMELQTGLGQNFTLPIQSNAQILQSPATQTIARAPVAGQRFTEALLKGGEAYGSAQAVQQARQDVATATGIPQEPLSFAQRLAIGLSPQLAQFHLKRAELQRKQAATSQIQDTTVTIDQYIREGKFDEAQSSLSRATRHAVFAPEFLPQLDNLNKRIVETRIARGIREGYTKALKKAIETSPSPSKDLLLTYDFLTNPDTPQEALDRHFEHISPQIAQSIGRREFRLAPELRQGYTYEGGTGTLTTTPLITGFSTSQMSDQLREAAAINGMSMNQIELAVAAGLDPGKLLQMLQGTADQREQARKLVDAAPRFAPSGTLSGATPLPQAQQAVTGGEAQQKEDIARREREAAITAEQATQPLQIALPNHVIYDPTTFQRGPIALRGSSYQELRQQGWVVLGPDEVKQADRLTDGFNAISELQRAFKQVPDVARTRAEVLLEKPFALVERLGARWSPIAALISANKTKSVAEVARASLQKVLDEMFPEKGEVYGNVRRYLDSVGLSNQEAVDGVISQLERVLTLQRSRLFGTPYGVGGQGESETLPPGSPIPPIGTAPQGGTPGTPGTAKPPGIAAPQVITPGVRPGKPRKGEPDPDFGPPVRIQ